MIEKCLKESTLPLLEAEILLAHTLNVSRTYLRTWPLQAVEVENSAKFNLLVERRKKGEPIAYLLGFQEFWSLSFQVSEAVLIPRSETEILVEQLLLMFPKAEPNIRILDLGTGSGALAISIAKERPHWRVVATDKSKEALEIAKRNAKALSVENVQFLDSDWFSVFAGMADDQKIFHAIVSNPPYIAEGDKHLQEGDLRFEPKSALVSGIKGLNDLEKIIHEAQQYLMPKGWLLLEHGFLQGPEVMELLKRAYFTEIRDLTDLSHLPRIAMGQKKRLT